MNYIIYLNLDIFIICWNYIIICVFNSSALLLSYYNFECVIKLDLKMTTLSTLGSYIFMLIQLTV